ncbi:hypothetical protein GGR57DRAFT_500196 [Xylariaceae sp. FL1272]|nr:hypothetical protein GGR57DRAFT_500196 [Xylariaceae sp. FL1272]
MLGNTDPSDDEHRLVPIAKIIDFGRAEEFLDEEVVNNEGHEPYDEDDDDDAMRENLFEVSQIIYHVIALDHSTIDEYFATAEYQGITTRAVLLTNPIAWLNDELRDVVCRSMATEDANRFTLRLMLRITERNAAGSPTRENIPGKPSSGIK